MAKEYIEREAVVKELEEELDFESPMYTADQNKHINIGLKIALRTVNKLSTADVVEVPVQCKDCKYGWKCCSGKIACQRDGRVAYEMLFEPTSYCSYGKRRDNDAAD